MTASEVVWHVLTSAGGPGVAQVVLGAAGLAWAIVVAVQLARGRRVAPALATAPLGLHAVVVLIAVVAAWRTHAAAVSATDEVQAIGGLMFNLLLTLTALPGMAVLALGGFAGGFRGPRVWGPAVAVSAVAAALAAGVPLLGLGYGAVPALAIGRSLLYGCGAVLIAGASAGAEPDRRQASVIAAVAFSSGVVAVEALLRAIAWIDCLAAVAHHEEDAAAFLGSVADAIAATGPVSWAAIGLAGIPLVVACLRAPRSPAALVAAAVPSSWLAVWVLADPAALIAAVVASMAISAG